MRKSILIVMFLLPALASAQPPYLNMTPGFSSQGTYQGTQTPTSFCNGGICTYTALEPLSPWQTSYPNIQSYLQAAFSILLTLGALFAVVMLTLSGIRYMLSESITDVTKAVNRIRSSILGLLLLASSWLILNTINPELLIFKIPNVPGQSGVNPQNQPTQNQGSGGGGGTDSPRVTVGGLQTYSLNAPELRQLIEQAGIKNDDGSPVQLRGTSDGRAVVIIPNQNIPSYAAYLNEFSKQCEVAQGTIQTVQLPTSSTAYFCFSA